MNHSPKEVQITTQESVSELNNKTSISTENSSNGNNYSFFEELIELSNVMASFMYRGDDVTSDDN